MYTIHDQKMKVEHRFYHCRCVTNEMKTGARVKGSIPLCLFLALLRTFAQGVTTTTENVENSNPPSSKLT